MADQSSDQKSTSVSTVRATSMAAESRTDSWTAFHVRASSDNDITRTPR